jgi:hypothetical protein
VQPGGDSPTRADFYVAVLSGCVPVIFDAKLPRYSAPTRWAWRRASNASNASGAASAMFIDYDTFTVLVGRRAQLDHSWLDTLRTIASGPQLGELRAGLMRVAHLFHCNLSPQAECQGSAPCEPPGSDAFGHFYKLLAEVTLPLAAARSRRDLSPASART